ncbi:hypothetical protein [Pseudanabaena yagii]|uniref:hypothetical protein n=1 Tax=Pseudanabaena yagii TaxID=2661615 RepID=UPI001B7D188E|nr:hypothetical protein [Pseudanabaena yagii]
MTNRELLKQHIDQLDDIDIQQISQFVEFLIFCHQKNQSDRQTAQAVKEDPLIGLFAGSPNLATQSEEILNQNIQTNSGWTWKPSSQIQDL